MTMLACAMSRPFEGPGFVDGELTLDHPGPFLVAATHGRPAPGQSDAFQDHVRAIVETLDAMDADSGLVGYSLRGEIGGRDNWTVSVWTSEEAMYDFVVSDVHAAAMAEADVLMEEGTFTHWEEPDATALPPDWDVVIDELDATDPTY
jgi:quinol monooxygenase YgiN